MTERRETVIVGASAAGLYTAILLATSERRVSVFERMRTNAAAARTLIVTSSYRDLLGPIGERAVVNEIRRFELFADGQVAAVDLARPDLVIERTILLEDLAAEAQARGAELRFGTRFLGLYAASGGVGLTFADGAGSRRLQVAASTAVGADGANSAVASAAGWQPQPTLSLLQALVALPDGANRHTSKVWFRPEDTPYFYWLIPESEHRAVLGVIGEDGAALRHHLRRFMREKGFEAVEWQAARIPRYEGWRSLKRGAGDGAIYLVGDAAGHVKVSTVGGIVTGFRGSRAVAERIMGRGGGESRRLRRELEAHRLVRRAIHRFTEDDYRSLLRRLDGRASTRVGSHSRDRAGRMLVDLVRTDPRVALLAARGLARRGGLGAGSARGEAS